MKQQTKYQKEKKNDKYKCRKQWYRKQK
jgi:hypothetical protein